MQPNSSTRTLTLARNEPSAAIRCSPAAAQGPPTLRLKIRATNIGAVRHRVTGTLAGVPFGLFATFLAFIFGPASLVAGPITGFLVGLIAAEVSRFLGSHQTWLRVPASLILAWSSGIALLLITTLAALVAEDLLKPLPGDHTR